MKFGFGRGRRAPTVEEFKAAYTQMRTQHEPPARAGIPPIEAMANREAYDWVANTTAAVRLPSRAYLWGVAVEMAGFRLLAQEMHMEPFLTARQVQTPEGPRIGERHNLPPIADWVPGNHDVSLRFTPTPEQYNIALRYLSDEDVGTIPETLLDNGVHILGALALMPEGSGIAVRDEAGNIFGRHPEVRLTGLEPYPASLSFRLP